MRVTQNKAKRRRTQLWTCVKDFVVAEVSGADLPRPAVVALSERGWTRVVGSGCSVTGVDG